MKENAITLSLTLTLDELRLISSALCCTKHIIVIKSSKQFDEIRQKQNKLALRILSAIAQVGIKSPPEESCVSLS